MVHDQLSASQENYLEAILELDGSGDGAHVSDIADHLQVRKASVSGALRNLAGKNLVNYRPYDTVTLTRRGERLARDVHQRHAILKDFLQNVLSVQEGEANDTACRMEHVISPAVLERFVAFIEFVRTCPRAGEDWIRRFSERCGNPDQPRDCDGCVQELTSP